ncbi:MAG: hypothetical protein A2017_17130 [Lentisphaerae bacterium GWF2_44_16]|nr:MAG: hypothetical protein A2017_17130 [Lentisphaerae bacterium GWF2_44_16]
MKFLISAGPTREKIDPVRFITNYSSGKMGYALAGAAADAGHETILVSGPVCLEAPRNVTLISVETAAEMAAEIKKVSDSSDIIIMAAAVADYRPIKVHSEKMKKGSGNITLELERTEDILASLGKIKHPGQILAGFAAETNKLLENALKKLNEKNLDWIIANEVGGKNSGFMSDENSVTMLSADGEKIVLPLENKKSLAVKIISVLTSGK